MGDTQQRPGWWQASDLKWYPPESHPDYVRALPPPPIDHLPAPTADHVARPVAAAASGFDPASGVQPGRQWAPRVKVRHLLIIGICVAYVVSPIDIAPEALLGPLGLPDDMIAAVLAIGVYFARVRGKELPGS